MEWIIDWLADHEPVFCASCGRLMFRKDAAPVLTLSGQFVNLCKICLDNWMHPEE